jgi:ribosomal protein L37AE/L43A
MFTQRKEQLKPKDIQHAEAVANELGNLDLDASPTCDECGEHYSPRRLALGYHTCLDCGSPAKTYAIVPVPKSNYVIATNIEAVRSPYSHKGNNQS